MNADVDAIVSRDRDLHDARVLATRYPRRDNRPHAARGVEQQRGRGRRGTAVGGGPAPGAGPHRYTAHRHHGGQQRVLDAVAVALDGPDRERLVLVTARDVTEQRNLEEALRQSAEDGGDRPAHRRHRA